jgi:hypothetical protein
MKLNDPEQNLAVRNGTVPGEGWVQIGTVRCQDCQERYSMWRRGEGEAGPEFAQRCEIYLQRELVREHVAGSQHGERYRLPSTPELPDPDGSA